MVYEDTRRAAAGRRLDRTLDAAPRGRHRRARPRRRDRPGRPRSATRSPSSSRRSTRSSSRRIPQQKSGWLRQERRRPDSRRRGRACPSSTSSSTSRRRRGERNVLVIANETRARRAAPRPDPRARRARRCELPDHLAAERSDAGAHPEAERRLRRALAELRGEGIEAHGQIAHPDPFTAAHAGDRRRAGRRDHRLDVPARALRLAAARPASSACATRRTCPSSTSMVDVRAEVTA